MSIRDFVKKHKKKLVAASGILASLLAMTHLAGKINPLNLPPELEYVVDPNYSLNEPLASIRDILRRERRYSDPIRLPARDESKRPRGGKSNTLLKAVQAYRKKHGCSLKEAWAAVRQ
jgi:hypothetical protein